MKEKKVCGKCGQEKRRSEFGQKKSSADGKQPWCKKCNTEYLAQWYADNKLPHRETIRHRRTAYKQAAIQFVVEYLLDHPCVQCGEDDPIVLEFDHRNPSDKTAAIAKLVMEVTSTDFSYLREEMDKCDVRCANCHRRITAKVRNYSRYKVCVELGVIDY